MYTQLLFFGCITCLNVSSIVDTAQVVDTFLGHWVRGGSAAINLFWNDDNDNDNNDGFGWRVRIIHWSYELCSEEMMITGECLPFLHYDEGVLFTMGYAITLLIFLPMALMDLKVRKETRQKKKKENSYVSLLSNATISNLISLFLSEHDRKTRPCKWWDSWCCW
jgi:hypothetical protein